MSAFEDFIQVELPRRPWVDTDPAQETVPVRRGAGPRQLAFVELTEGQVLGHTGGVTQGIDISSLSTKSYVHEQTVAADVWFVTHTLNSEDYVAFVVDASGVQIFPDSISTTDADLITIVFNTPITGKAVIVFAS